MQPILEQNCILLPEEKTRLVQNTINRDVFSKQGVAYFLGSLPVTMSRHNLQSQVHNRQQRYLATPKADGERYFLIVGGSRELMLFSRSRQIWMIRNARAPEGVQYSVFDGELVLCKGSSAAARRKSPRALKFLCCDALQWNSRSLIEEPLLARLGIAASFCESYAEAPESSTNNALWRIEFKPYYDVFSSRVFMAQQLERLDYEVDGFVFASGNTAYIPGTDSSMFKWKPLISMNTVDFLVEYNAITNETLFSVRCGDRQPLGGLRASSNRQTSVKYKCPGNALLEQLQLSESCIVECEPLSDGENLAWRLLKVRHDKRIPNFEGVYDDACRAVQEKIGFREIFPLE